MLQVTGLWRRMSPWKLEVGECMTCTCASPTADRMWRSPSAPAQRCSAGLPAMQPGSFTGQKRSSYGCIFAGLQLLRQRRARASPGAECVGRQGRGAAADCDRVHVPGPALQAACKHRRPSNTGGADARPQDRQGQGDLRKRLCRLLGCAATINNRAAAAHAAKLDALGAAHHHSYVLGFFIAWGLGCVDPAPCA
jgi:hypothetical protein